jgi:hypothetical protein
VHCQLAEVFTLDNALCEGYGTRREGWGCGLGLRVNNLRAGVASCAHVQHHTCTGEEIKGGRRGHIIRKMCSSAILDSKSKLTEIGVVTFN